MNNGINSLHGIIQRHNVQHISFYPFYFIQNVVRNVKGKFCRTVNGSYRYVFFNQIF